MAQPSLSDLCSICYTEIPKYRCPRCKTQTCSLPCYKRHQQRASCSGKRDPTAYLKKSQLATAASVDRDYNYLKGVERSIDDAGVYARERGAGLPSDSQGRGLRREGAFMRYLTSNRIAVEYAPKGLSRQKTNRSRVTKNSQIYWTIEWRDGSGEHELRHDAPESSLLSELYKGVQATKRKRKAAAIASNDSARESGKRLKASARTTNAGNDAHMPSEDEKQEMPAVKHSPPNNHDAASNHETLRQTELKTDQQQENYFYLLKPVTTGSARVLIPVEPSKTLTKILEGQTMQEYPTIYVLHDPPDSLPRGFMHVDSHQDSRHDGLKSSGLPARSSAHDISVTNSQQAEKTGAESELDAKAILDMLKRDVRV